MQITKSESEMYAQEKVVYEIFLRNVKERRKTELQEYMKLRKYK